MNDKKKNDVKTNFGMFLSLLLLLLLLTFVVCCSHTLLYNIFLCCYLLQMVFLSIMFTTKQ